MYERQREASSYVLFYSLHFKHLSRPCYCLKYVWYFNTCRTMINDFNSMGVNKSHGGVGVIAPRFMKHRVFWLEFNMFSTQAFLNCHKTSVNLYMWEFSGKTMWTTVCVKCLDGRQFSCARTLTPYTKWQALYMVVAFFKIRCNL